MKILSLSLEDFIPFKNNTFNKLEVEYTSDVQIILGSNGSSKTTSTRQLSPYSSSKSLFNKDGFKTLLIEKDGVIYKLESEFSKSSPHYAFYEGDNEENLNPGRTGEVQKEKIVELLGITPLVDDLMMNRYTFPKWGPSDRKEFIMDNNPDQVGFVLVELKKVSSKIKACKHVMSRLQSRKIMLEQDLLKEDVLQSLLDEKQDINNELSLFEKYRMDLEVGDRSIAHTQAPNFNIPTIKNSLKQYRYKLANLSHIERDDRVRADTRENLIGAIASANQHISMLDEETLKLHDELRDLESRYMELAPSEDLTELDSTISRLESERDRLYISTPPFELSREELDKRYSEWDHLKDELLIFTDCDIPLYTRKKRDHRAQVLINTEYRLGAIEMALGTLRERYDSLSRKHSLTPRDIPESPCAKDRCPLYSHFMGEYESHEKQRVDTLRKIKRLEYREYRHKFLISALKDYRDKSKHYHDKIHWLVSTAQSNPILHSVLRQMDILVVLKNNPNLISKKLRETYDHIDRYLKLKSVINDLDVAYSLRSRKLGSQSADTVNLIKGIENHKKSLYELRRRIYEVSNNRDRLNTHLNEINLFNTLKQSILSIRDLYIEQCQFLSDRHEKDKLLSLKNQIDKMRSDRFSRLSSIENTLRTQDNLRYSYNNEVLNELSVIEKDMKDLEQIEKTLISIPKESTVWFVNTLFAQANLIIKSVWTIPLEIELLTMEDNLNYKFYAIGDNNSRRELSECSDGENEIITLAINLALRIVLGHTNIPLCLDESGKTFDDRHKENLLLLLKKLLEDKIISQLFLVSHTALIHEGFSDSQTLVLREDNLVLPPEYNLHCTMT
jgi:hypothetical protein